MQVYERYLLRSTAISFCAALIALTAVVWITQALRELDLVTAQGQTIWTFFVVTGLALPALALVVAPIALFGAVAFVLNRLNADSELAALSAAGLSPVRLMRPFATFATLVAVLVGVLSISAIPGSLRSLRDIVTKIHADVVINVLREGAFTTLDQGITLHVRQRGPGGALLGIFVEDDRDPGQNLVYTAERGRVIEAPQGTYLVLENGAVQRKVTGQQDPNIVLFERYAFDLSPLGGNGEVTFYKPRERYISDLWRPDPSDAAVREIPGRFRAELHERLVNPLYPLAFMLIAFAALGYPRTTRQTRYGALAVAVALVFVVRIVGLGATNLVARTPLAVPLLYAVPISPSLISLMVILGLSDRFTFSLRLPRLSPAAR